MVLIVFFDFLKLLSKVGECTSFAGIQLFFHQTLGKKLFCTKCLF
jgi:hypothetical protein